ncbi:uncharacterized protein LOC136085513 [Hydra vulgaris]|uniref:Uncharacterized protein LOC136085513 n=1 Tax=Hydra vulgaris TaxID=6087 RepID=A0ABM4CM61_HYDVU
MMIYSTKLSGAENRKRSHANNDAQAEILLKTAKLETYFNFTDKQPRTSPSENQNGYIFTVNKDNLSNPDNLILVTKSSTETSKTLLSTELEEIIDTPRFPMDQHNSLSKQSIVPKKPLFKNDPTSSIENQETIDYLSINGFYQNLENNFQKSKRIYIQIIRGIICTRFRYLSKSIFVSNLVYSEKINRTFLIYSESKGSIFCAPCYLLGGTTLFATVGFFDQKKEEEKIKRHVNLQHHKLCVMNMNKRKEVLNRVDQKLKYQVETKINYWKNLLTRLEAVVKSLSFRGMSFRGDKDRFGSVHNGNFMMSLELIAQFDLSLAQHI